MLTQVYSEVAEELQKVVWDIEDANDTHTDFSEGRFEELKKLYHKCEIFMAEFEKYQKLRGKE
jgi:hypothetical protein